MKPCFDNIIVGSSLTGLVAALELAKQKQTVLLISPSAMPGGHFAGVLAMGRRFDVGMVIMELTSFNADKGADLRTYDLNVRNDVGRFFPIIKTYIEKYVDLVLTPRPKTFFRGQCYDDFFLTNSFEVLGALSAGEREIVRSELEGLLQPDNQLHARFKSRERERFLEASFSAVSKANHGSTIHHLFVEPFLRKVLNTGSESISALAHRLCWLPLYYPETLLSQFGNTPQTLGDTHFHYPAGSTMHALPEALMAALANEATATIEVDRVTRIDSGSQRITTLGGQTFSYGKLLWLEEPATFMKAVGAETPIKETAVPQLRASLAMCFFVVSKMAITKSVSSVFIVDEDLHAYRYSNLQVCSGGQDVDVKLVVEFNMDRLNSHGIAEDDAIIAEGLKTLLHLGVINDPSSVQNASVLRLPNRLHIPTPSSLNEFARQRQAALSTFTDDTVVLGGNSSGVETKSFADCIAQGLKFAEIAQI